MPELSEPSAADVPATPEVPDAPALPAQARPRPAPAPVPRVNPIPVSDSIALKLSELDARLAAEAPARVEPAAPVKKAAVKRAPAEKVDLVKDAPLAAELPPELPEVVPEELPDVLPVVAATAPPFGAGLRAAVVAIVVLLAAAAGMGAAAVVENGASATDTRAWLAGGMAAGLVLVLAFIVLITGRARSRER